MGRALIRNLYKEVNVPKKKISVHIEIGQKRNSPSIAANLQVSVPKKISSISARRRSLQVVQSI